MMVILGKGCGDGVRVVFSYILDISCVDLLISMSQRSWLL